MTWNYATGNFLKRKDVIKNKEESFSYDNLDRLSGSTIIGQATQNISYGNNGNILSKTDIGDYTYGISKPNAVTEVTNTPGNIPYATQTVTYTPFMQPLLVGENTATLRYTYGDDYQRIKSVYSFNGTAVNTRYYLAGYDKNIASGVTRYVHYVSGPAGLVAIVVSEAGNHSYYYVYTDHLGSIVTATNNSGAIVAEQNFDAWGRRRDPVTWVQWPQAPPVSFPAWLYRGYTGHEHMENFGLINMNGRVYDPVIGRVLSPDNYVQNIYDSQDYNRYSYASNSPLVYSDPDGQWVEYVVGAVVGGFNGWRIGKAAGAHGWGMVGYITGGAAIGAATAGIGNAVLGGFSTAATSGMTLGQSVLAYGASGAVSGAFSGGAYAGLSGQNVWRGMGTGALWGGVGGAVSGGIQHLSFLNTLENSPYLAQNDDPIYGGTLKGVTVKANRNLWFDHYPRRPQVSGFWGNLSYYWSGGIDDNGVVYDKSGYPYGRSLTGSPDFVGGIGAVNAAKGVGSLGAGRTGVRQWLQNAGNLERGQLIKDIEGAGFKLTSPTKAPLQVFERGGMRIRLDPPQGKTLYNHMHLEYGGNSYNNLLNPVNFKSPTAHIPIR